MPLKRNLVAEGCLLAGMIATQAAHADGVIQRLNNHFDAALGMEHLSYHEINPASGPVHKNTLPTGADLDGETGTLFSPGLSLAFQRNLWFIHNVRAEASLHMAFGDATYNGHLQDQNGNIVAPLVARTGETFTDLQLKIGKGICLLGSERDLLTPYAAYGLNEWHRKGAEDTPYGYSEQYRNRFWAAGLQYQIALTSKLVLKADGSYGRTLSPRMNASNLFGTFELGATPLHNYELGLTYSTSRSAYIGIDTYWMRYAYNESPLVIDYTQGIGAYEPGSKTNRYGITTVFGYSF